MFLPIAFYGDDYIDVDKIRISPLDLGVQRGYSIFDFFKLKALSNPWIDRYMKRLKDSAQAVQLELPYSTGKVVELSKELFKRNKITDGFIKIILSAGPSDNGYHRTGPAHLLIFALPPSTLPDRYYRKGASLMTCLYQRDLPFVKTTNYIKSAMLADKLKAGDFSDVLYHDGVRLSEASRCNIFLVRENTIITPDQHVLKGITRSRVMSLKDLSVDVKADEVLLSHLYHEATEVFITSTTKGVMPITKIDDKIIGNGTVGPLTKEVMTRINSF